MDLRHGRVDVWNGPNHASELISSIESRITDTHFVATFSFLQRYKFLMDVYSPLKDVKHNVCGNRKEFP